MNYANWIPLVTGMALILGLMAYIFRTRVQTSQNLSTNNFT